MADESTDDGAVLLLDPCLIVLLVGTRACQLHSVLVAEGEEGVVDDVAAIIHIKATKREWKREPKSTQGFDHEAALADQEGDTLCPAAGDVREDCVCGGNG
jgi:hypothetical protein